MGVVALTGLPTARTDHKNGFRVAKFYIRCSKALSFAKIAKSRLTFLKKSSEKSAQTVAIFAKVLSYTE